ncbi:MAG: hypothetical protein GX567_00275 [Clostridia bacterium]|nr:hypothetical protein [Clostridia bacterium]
MKGFFFDKMLAPTKGGGNPWPSYWATQYKARVEADGGEVILSNYIKNDVAKIEEIDEFDNLVLGLSSVGGLKVKTVRGSKVASKVYDYSALSNDASVATDDNMPAIYSNFKFLVPNILDFEMDEAFGVKYLDHAPILDGNFTAFYVIQQRKNAAIDAFHSGHFLVNGEMAICASVNSWGLGPSMFRARPLPEIGRGSNEYAPVFNCRVLTYQPDHIYLNGTEVTYKSGYEATIPSIALKRIGARYDTTTAQFYGSLVSAMVFKTILSDEKRQTIEAHLNSQYLNSDYTKSTITPVSFTELTYRILSQRGDAILAVEMSGTRRVMYSTDNGSTWVYNTVTRVTWMGHIFGNGTLFVTTQSKVYKSDDGLVTMTEITPLDDAGDPYSVAGNSDFNPFHIIDYQTIGANELILFGTYPGPPCCIWASVNGQDCKQILVLDAAHDYNATHIHICNYSPASGKWYVTTGDTVGYHWFEIEYDGSFTVTHILTGVDSDQIKAVSMQAVGDYLYWSADITNAAISNRGIWRCLASDFGTTANHERIFACNTEFNAIYVDGDEILFTSYYPNTLGIRLEWEIYKYNINTGAFKRYVFNNITRTRKGVTNYTHMIITKSGDKYHGVMYGTIPASETIEFELI